MLIALVLEQRQVLPTLTLPLSIFFRTHQDEYYRRLTRVRAEGDYGAWLEFFLDGVCRVSAQCVECVEGVVRIATADRARVMDCAGASMAAMKLFETLPKNPIVTVNSAMRILGATKPTAGKAIDVLLDAQVLKERTGRKRGREFGYEGLLREME